MKFVYGIKSTPEGEINIKTSFKSIKESEIIIHLGKHLQIIKPLDFIDISLRESEDNSKIDSKIDSKIEYKFILDLKLKLSNVPFTDIFTDNIMTTSKTQSLLIIACLKKWKQLHDKNIEKKEKQVMIDTLNLTLLSAIRNRQWEFAEKVLDENKMYINFNIQTFTFNGVESKNDIQGEMCFLFKEVVAEKSQINLFKKIILASTKNQVNSVFNSGSTLLMSYLEKQKNHSDLEVVKLLVDKEIDLNKTDKNKQSAFTISAKYGLTEILNLLYTEYRKQLIGKGLISSPETNPIQIPSIELST